jgi:hypothetical protein
MADRAENNQLPEDDQPPVTLSRSGKPIRTRIRRKRSVSESLLSIVLALEAILVFFVALTVFGLKILDAPTALIGSAVIIIALLVGGRVLRYPRGVWVGWALQLALIATGFVFPLMFAVGAGFVALWIFCFIRGRQIDAQIAEQSPSPDSPTDKE